ncbi:carbohydrate-binding protein [Streptomyces sp. NPDC052043]|uniref:carbohydrate-binding protein n=1 Tax=Streptomyces sp. NPDC052043 TaxID=3365684 RepID=UPI0037D475E2
MTPGNSGASTPEDDDPFGYLYADGQANGAQPPSGGYGYPNAVNRVRTVGQRQYGQQAPASPHGQVPQQQGTFGQPNAHYAAPETLPGGGPTGRKQSQGGGRGPNTKGLLIGAVAVVAAVVIGICVAMLSDDSGKKDDNQAGGATPTVTQSDEPAPTEKAGEKAPEELPKIDAKALHLDGGATLASDVQGADADGGVYVAGFNQVGAKVTWTVNGIPKSGSYRLYVRYGIPGVDANATLVVNDHVASQPLNMKNFSGMPEGDWEKGWQTTWALVNLNKGTNTIVVACNDGNQCNANLDQLELKNN